MQWVHRFISRRMGVPWGPNRTAGLIGSIVTTAGASTSHRNAWDNTSVTRRWPTWETGTGTVSHRSHLEIRIGVRSSGDRTWVENVGSVAFPSPVPAENESAVLRFNYGDPNFGTCQETIKVGLPSSGPTSLRLTVLIAFCPRISI